MKGHDLLLRIVQVDGPHLIGIAGASLRRRGEDDVVPQVKGIGLSVGITEGNGWRRFISCAEIELMQRAVAGKDIDRSGTRRLRWSDNRRRCQTSGAQRIRGAATARRRRIVEVLFP